MTMPVAVLSIVGAGTLFVGAVGLGGAALDFAAYGLSLGRPAIIALVSLVCGFVSTFALLRGAGILAEKKFPTTLDCLWAFAPFMLAIILTDGSSTAAGRVTELISAGGMAGDAMRSVLTAMAAIGHALMGLSIPVQFLAAILGAISFLCGHWGFFGVRND